MRKFVAIVLSLVLILSICPLGLFSLTASAETDTSGTTGDCTWWLEGTVLTISGNGSMTNYTSSSILPWGTEITKVIISEGITRIGDYAFSNCAFITEISFPDSIKSIGQSAFYGCYSIDKFIIPEGVESIGSRAFAYCRDVKEIVIPSTVSSLPNDVFDGDFNLTDLTIKGGVSTYKNRMFCELEGLKNLYLYGNDYTISDNCFYYFYNLKKLVLGGNIKSIGNNAFKGCSGLTDIWYSGAELDRAEISIGTSNSELENATWHYNTCETHTYSMDCDNTCENCEWTRDANHSYTLNGGYTCSVCKFSKKPEAPTIEDMGPGYVVLKGTEGFEYGIGEEFRPEIGIVWQDSPVFNIYREVGQNPGIWFCQRVKASDIAQQSDTSATLFISLPATPSAPSAPELVSKTEYTVTLKLYDGYEYSIDGVNWQDSNVFTELSHNTSYNFYQRVKETPGCFASFTSPALTVTTENIVVGISINTTINKNSYLEGKDNLDLTDGTLLVKYEDNTDEVIPITADMVSGFNNKITGVQTLTITYRGYTAEITVYIVPKTLISIVLIPQNLKTEYSEKRDELDVSGGTMLALTYNNDTIETIELTKDMVSGFDNSVVGKQTLTVSYGGKTTTYEIEIIARNLTGIKITKTPNKTEYLEVKDQLNVVGGQITLYYDNETEETIAIKESMVTGFDNTKVGEQVLTVNYGEKTAEFVVIILGLGDIDGVDGITDADAEWLLMFTFFPDDYPVNQTCDFNGDGKVNDADAEHLLMFTFFPEDYPLH
ncbi:MAG: hypothetical protein E7526_05070 [Ruminococcaceae bacterium]|nr:hypothetical protein [Oscillospiraceae bacterium]